MSFDLWLLKNNRRMEKIETDLDKIVLKMCCTLSSEFALCLKLGQQT